MFTIEGDRRVHPRMEVQQPCKIHDPRSGKYYSGLTRDISTQGLLMEFSRLLNLKPGDLVHVGVAMKRRQGLLQAKEMIEARVVRSMQSVNDQTLLAVEFANAVAEVPEGQQYRAAA